MQLRPRYGDVPLIVLDGAGAGIAAPTIRQRRRLVQVLEGFDEAQWANPSRCDGWSNRDVIIHLDSTNTFWAFSMAQGLEGEPTEFLATFDPVASPAELVVACRDQPASEVLASFVASTEALTDLLASLGEADWSVLAEAPPGHVSIAALAHHALWDAWVHERDILLPLGLAPVVEADEVAASLRYGAALGPAFAVSLGGADRGVLAVDVTDPEVSFVVDIADQVVVQDGPATAELVLTGDAVEVLEALSIRGPLAQHIPAESSWMLNGLAEIFDVLPG